MKRFVTSQCTYRCVVLPDLSTRTEFLISLRSQCTYRCVVLPDPVPNRGGREAAQVSMHLQVRGAP